MSNQYSTKMVRHLFTLPDLCLLTIIDHLPLDTVHALLEAFVELRDRGLERAAYARRRSALLNFLDEDDQLETASWLKQNYPLAYMEAIGQPYGRNMVEWVVAMMPNLKGLFLNAKHRSITSYDVSLMNMVLCARFGQLTHLCYRQDNSRVSNLAILCTVGAMVGSLKVLDLDIVLPSGPGQPSLYTLPFPVLSRLRRFTYFWAIWDDEGRNLFDPVAFCRWVARNYAGNRALRIFCREDWFFEQEISVEELEQIYAIPNGPPLDQFEGEFYYLSTQDYRLSDLRRYCSRFCSLNQITIGLTTESGSLWDVLQYLAPMKKTLRCLQVRIYPLDIAPLLVLPVSNCSQPPPPVVFESLHFMDLELYDKIDLRPMLCLQHNQLGAVFPNLESVFVSVSRSFRPEWSEEERQSLLALEPELRKLFQQQCPKFEKVSIWL